jgi:hypothetical protein
VAYRKTWLVSPELLGFWTLYIVWYSKKLENATFRKLDLFPSSGEGGETPTLLDPLERANLNHWRTYASITTAIQIPETRFVNGR